MSLGSNINKRTKGDGRGGSGDGKGKEPSRAVTVDRLPLLKEEMLREIEQSRTIELRRLKGDGDEIVPRELEEFLRLNLESYPPPTNKMAPSSDGDETGVMINVMMLYHLWKNHGLANHYLSFAPSRKTVEGYMLHYTTRFRQYSFDYHAGSMRLSSTGRYTYPVEADSPFVLGINLLGNHNTRELSLDKDECVVMDASSASHGAPMPLGQGLRALSSAGLRSVWRRNTVPVFAVGYCVHVRAVLRRSSPEGAPGLHALHTLFVRPTVRNLAMGEFVRACNDGLASLGVTGLALDDSDPDGMGYTIQGSPRGPRPLRKLLDETDGYVIWGNDHVLDYTLRRVAGRRDDATMTPSITTVVAYDFHGKEPMVAYQDATPPAEAWQLYASLRSRLFHGTASGRVLSMDHPLMIMATGSSANGVSPIESWLLEQPPMGRLPQGLLDGRVLVYRSKLAVHWYPVDDEGHDMANEKPAGKLYLLWEPGRMGMAELLEAFLSSAEGHKAGWRYSEDPERVRFYALDNEQGLDHGDYTPIVSNDDVVHYVIEPALGAGGRGPKHASHKLMVGLQGDSEFRPYVGWRDEIQSDEVMTADNMSIKEVMQNLSALGTRCKGSR